MDKVSGQGQWAKLMGKVNGKGQRKRANGKRGEMWGICKSPEDRRALVVAQTAA